ncbi:mitochondrial ubiquitin ligase activator of NFKB 1 [Pleuronectes platessa]|uniref:mitochondrial ubiquitin ligase activator of NFKB 1 n=1 Tax=Pleuronectes platessa TaxID=8262 RepID=UPI00232A0886|nr:mitochondrial ubiquitin ligase activator of NFKB 1 [Pleuronectes platessa]XP_053280515.1 mitochondrial ubiquitin ligase activator of NFKB 1 [Pleuronectes platessa]XP_062248618.1 mitochondrial ubiquitin ligase activator of NFKB 1 [Platichthys flesus]XP_062248619.1 mitochondrial ubiquitin ligase activator of NFKB 1 [Platichthys flesus]
MDSSGKPSTAQIVVLATSSALTGLFYTIYKNRATTVARLKEAKKVTIDKDLCNLLSETPGRCVPYAVIEGAVRNVKETLSSQFVDNCKGVIERLTLKEEKMVWNRTTHLWNSTEKVIHQRTNTVPFALGSHDEDVSAFVRVIRPLDAAELDLETTYENFHPTVQSLSSVIGHFISGERPKGIHETEEMLRVGDSVTGVGELVLDNNLIKLQPPKQGFPYFLTRLDYDSLLGKQVKSVRLWRILALVSGLAACSTFFYILWKRYVLHKQSKKERSMLEEFKEQQKKRMRELNIEESSVSPTSCTVCLSRERSCVFLECGHVCACSQCYDALPQPKKCPICRATIDRVVPLYNS